jgi:hypothetical protein
MPWVAGKLVGTTRLEMLERGFTLVETPRFFRGNRLLATKNSMMLKLPDCKRRFPELARYGGWLQRLLQDALSEERVSLGILEFRYEAIDHADKLVDRLHADGSYIRSVYTLYGPSTIYREGKVERPVPSSQTLLMTATGRARKMRVPCTLHRRPGPGCERAVIVCSFESRAAGLSTGGRVLLAALKPGSHLTGGQDAAARWQKELAPEGKLGVGVVVGDGSSLGDPVHG